MSKNIFNSILVKKPKTSRFDLTHDVKLSGNLGELIPVCVLDCIPGDNVTLGCESIVKFAPLISPVMHRLDVTVHYFFVPYRLLWPPWEEYITGGYSVGGGVPDAPPAFPYFNFLDGSAGTAPFNRLADYMGIPDPSLNMTTPVAEKVNAMPFAAYKKIWRDYYMDQNLQGTPTPIEPLDNGDNSSGYASSGEEWGELMIRAWEHDYFTSALPFAQKGAAVQVPIGNFNDVPVNTQVNPPETDTATFWASTDLPSSTADSVATPIGTAVGGTIDPRQLYARTSLLTSASATINDLRRAEQLQKWLESNARAGSRYTESLLLHFGVKSSDGRLQRAEYITGVKSPVIISEVLNTTGTDDLPQGNMSGHGISVNASGGYGKSFFCEEHGVIMGILSVTPKTAYQNGLPKWATKTVDRFQFAWPEFANIGEQEVFNKEIFAFQGGAGEEVFGYVPRYAEYKFESNRVAGDFRTTLKNWQWGRIFATDTPPALNSDFIKCVPRRDPFAVTDETVDTLYIHCLNKISAVRRLPKYGVPTLG